MPKTAVGLFHDSAVVEDVVREIEALGFPRNEVRTMGEPLDLAMTGVTSVPHLDFEVALTRELMRIGATQAQAEAYVDGVRHQGVLVLTTGNEQEVDKAAAIMNRYGAMQIEESTGPEPQLPHVPRAMAAMHDSGVQAGRLREPTDGAAFFIW